MTISVIYTVPNTSGGWKNVADESHQAIVIYLTRAEAEDAGRAWAERARCDHVVHTREGTIGSRRSFATINAEPPGVES